MKTVSRIFLLMCLCSTITLTASGSGAPSHATWNSLLQRYVTADGVVDYSKMKADRRFSEYITTLSGVHPDDTWSKNEKMAFWINAYNAFTIKLVSDNLPLKSIKDLGEPWDMKFIDIEGNRYSLNDIEHEILRKDYKEPRIHFAVNCASISCPPLFNQAFTAGNLSSQLDKVTRNFVNDTDYNTVSKSTLNISPIFDWYRGDFDTSGGITAFFRKYSRTSVDANASVTFTDYDWSLNGK